MLILMMKVIKLPYMIVNINVPKVWLNIVTPTSPLVTGVMNVELK